MTPTDDPTAPDATDAAATGSDEAGTVRLVLHDGWAEVILDRPPLNVLDLATTAALDGVLAGLAAQDDLGSAVRLVQLSSASERAFCAGVSVEDHAADTIPAMLAGFHAACRRLRDLPVPTLAAVSGACLGGGMELAACCDLVAADAGAVFGQPEIDLACFPPLGAALYPALLGPRRAFELLATGRRFDAAEGRTMGLVSHVFGGENDGSERDAASFDDGLAALRATLLGKSGPVLQRLKRAVAAGRERPFPAALAEAERLYLELTDLDDLEEGLAAFFDKREPRWRHR